MELRTKLRRIIPPSREIYMCFHDLRLLDMRLTRGSYVDSRWRLASTDNLIYLKGKDFFV